MVIATDRTWPAGVAPAQMLGHGRLGELCLAEAKRVSRRRRTRSDVVVRPEWSETTRLVPVPDEVVTLRHSPLSIVEGDIPTAPLPPVIDSQQDVVTLPMRRTEPRPTEPRPTEPRPGEPRPTERHVSFRRSAARVPHSWVGPLVDEDHEAITLPLPEPAAHPVAAPLSHVRPSHVRPSHARPSHARPSHARPSEPMPQIATLLSSSVTDLRVSVTAKPFDLESAMASVRHMPVVDGESQWPPEDKSPAPAPQPPAGTQAVNVFVAFAVVALVAFAVWSIFADPSQRAAVMALLSRLGVG
jgi:hypothetical protein